MDAQPNRLLTPDEYLAVEREIKHECVAGEIFATAGTLLRHRPATLQIRHDRLHRCRPELSERELLSRVPVSP